jgi:asparagine synthetase B (glutamine-hydrolysing)
MGADEQMAGYGRHRKAYTSGGWAKLRTELDLDLHRLWERNLGRDDRVISDHGREARFPYLDANVMSFLQSRPLADICNLNLAPGVGDKQILRQIALRKGLVTAGGLVKRAIQFGSRIAHVSDKQRFGSRRKAKGDKNIF